MYDAALRTDPCLNVSMLAPEAEGAAAAFATNITACAEASADKLAGLATFLTARYNFGGTLFVARVLDARGRRLRPVHVKDGEHALRLAGAALQGNRHFVRTAVSMPLPCIEFYWAVFRPELVQIWVDNLADLYGNVNLVAADLLSRVFALEAYGVRATTVRIKPSSTGSQPPVGEQQQKQEQQQGDSGGGGPVADMEGGAAAAAAAGMQRWVLPALGSSGRRQLSSGSSSGSLQWQTAAKCWALRAARRLGGERAVLRVAPWLL